jgi:hypothetical protein
MNTWYVKYGGGGGLVFFHNGYPRTTMCIHHNQLNEIHLFQNWRHFNGLSVLETLMIKKLWFSFSLLKGQIEQSCSIGQFIIKRELKET